LTLGLVRTPQPLGSYSITLADNREGEMSGALQTINDDALLHFDVNINLNAESRSVALHGHAWAGNNQAEAVQAVIPLMGPLQNNRAQINWQRSF
ncbi:MAG: hypothetical protein WD356_03410, partial [Pseudomonadales bacterium]